MDGGLSGVSLPEAPSALTKRSSVMCTLWTYEKFASVAQCQSVRIGFACLAPGFLWGGGVQPPPPPLSGAEFLEAPQAPKKTFDWPMARRKIWPNLSTRWGVGASRSQSALHMHVLVCICSNVRHFRMITGMIHVGAEGGDAGLGVRVE